MTLRSILGDINPHRFRVVIVGGSIAGLTLAHALAAKSIDFVVLEAREEIAPNVGASIGFTGNAHRILDQLGMWDELAELATPIMHNYAWNDAGHLLGYTEAFKLSQVRHGYPVIFLTRQQALDVLWNRLPCKSRVLTGKKVVEMQQSSTEATVQCLDGSTYTGDIVVGADGVHSIIYKEMCRQMETVQLESSLSSEDKGMVMQYRGVFGISKSVTGIREGEMHNVFVKGASILVIGCKDHVFWIVGVKMERTYYASEALRFDQSQLEDSLAFLMNKYVCAGVQFKEVYQRTIRCNQLPLEEGMFERWNCGRVACIGDSVHKMTPNLGQGGCCAIEDAATLANTILEIVESPEKQQLPNIETRLDSWATASKPRMKLICMLSESVIRMQSLDNVVYKITGPIFSKYYMDAFADLISDMGVGGECISFLSLPERQHTGTMPFGKRHYIGAPIIPSGRLFWTIPLLICFFLTIITSPAKAPASSSWDVYSVIADLGIFQAIWTMESARFCNAITFMSL
ncbi:FAD binding domain protein [Aspergillus parasiticus SU-1]|uniref:FAD binding domain protein n=1 Tax=Aspergillus parasiticus (strain ATCC 56775 / NRRL 5862 / SRRC 143 / SU-1) TaxID=1403190 RepID=A0A0F0IRV7_ASPPU|nr:FAD binding domain protein [Aspergillus parasiticus SU-1]